MFREKVLSLSLAPFECCFSLHSAAPARHVIDRNATPQTGKQSAVGPLYRTFRLTLTSQFIFLQFVCLLPSSRRQRTDQSNLLPGDERGWSALAPTTHDESNTRSPPPVDDLPDPIHPSSQKILLRVSGDDDPSCYSHSFQGLPFLSLSLSLSLISRPLPQDTHHERLEYQVWSHRARIARR